LNARRATLPLTAQTAPFLQPQVTPPQQQREPPALLLETLRNLPNLKARVVCGMTLIPADRSIDPKMAPKANSDKPKNHTTYKIRPVQPSICW
jgi:hypothetical protein